MNDYIKEITLDLNCAKTPVTINSAQFDKGRKLSINVTADGDEFDISNCSAVFKGVRSDKTHFAIDCEVKTNKVMVIFKDTDLSVKGLTICKIVISDGTRTYSTQMCIIDVDSSLDGNITASNEYSILNRLIEQIHALNESGGILVDDELNEESKNPIQNSTVTKALSQKVSSSMSSTQLIKLADIDTTINGLQIKVNNNHITVKGTAKSDIYNRIAIDAGISQFEANTDYTVSVQNTTDKNGNYIGMFCNSQPVAVWDYDSVKPMNFDTATEIVLNWNIQAGTYDKEFDFKIELGTEATPFEPYYVVENIKNSSISFDKLDDEVAGKIEDIDSKASYYQFEDITEQLEVETGLYYGFNHTSMSDWECSKEPIKCNEGDIFRVTAATLDIDKQQQIVKCFDKNQKLVCSAFEAFTSAEDKAQGKYASITCTDRLFVVPKGKGVAFITFQCWKNGKMYSLQVKKAVPYTDLYGVTMNSSTSSLPSNELYGKSMYSDGDSIADGSVTNGISYADIITDRYNMTLTSKAVGDTTLAVRDDFTNTPKNSIYERVMSMEGEYDYILLDGGTNDVTYKVPLGEITEGVNAKLNEHTILGALEGICKFLNTNYCSAKKLFIFANTRVDGTFATTQDTFSKMKQVLNKWGIPYIDIGTITSLGVWNDEIKSEYFKDSIHPNLQAYEDFYVPCIEKALLYGSYIGSGGSGESADGNGSYTLTESDIDTITTKVLENFIDVSEVGL